MTFVFRQCHRLIRHGPWRYRINYVSLVCNRKLKLIYRHYIYTYARTERNDQKKKSVVVCEKKFNIKKAVICRRREKERVRERKRLVRRHWRLYPWQKRFVVPSFFSFLSLFSLFLLNICHRCLHTCACFFLFFLPSLFFRFHIHYIKTCNRHLINIVFFNQ